MPDSLKERQMLARTAAQLDPLLRARIELRARELAQQEGEDDLEQRFRERIALELLIMGEAFVVRSVRAGEPGALLDPRYVEVTPMPFLNMPPKIVYRPEGAGMEADVTDEVTHYFVRRHPYDSRGETFIRRSTTEPGELELGPTDKLVDLMKDIP